MSTLNIEVNNDIQIFLKVVKYLSSHLAIVEFTLKGQKQNRLVDTFSLAKINKDSRRRN